MSSTVSTRNVIGIAGYSRLLAERKWRVCRPEAARPWREHLPKGSAREGASCGARVTAGVRPRLINPATAERGRTEIEE